MSRPAKPWAALRSHCRERHSARSFFDFLEKDLAPVVLVDDAWLDKVVGLVDILHRAKAGRDGEHVAIGGASTGRVGYAGSFHTMHRLCTSDGEMNGPIKGLVGTRAAYRYFGHAFLAFVL